MCCAHFIVQAGAPFRPPLNLALYFLGIKMIKLLFLVPALFLSSSAGACGFFTGLFTTEDVDIDYVGTIKLGAPFQSDSNTFIPLDFIGGKWLQNSGVTFKEVNANVKGQDINFTVKTCLVSGDSQNQEQKISLKILAPGEYNINYINPNGSSVYVGKIKI